MRCLNFNPHRQEQFDREIDDDYYNQHTQPFDDFNREIEHAERRESARVS